jgi:hypothetical protein
MFDEVGELDLREQILKEIRRLTDAGGGKVPGRRLFESETGIKESAWYGVYWVRWSEAVAEAGFAPNTQRRKPDEAFYLKKLADAFRHYGRIPTVMELRMYRNNIDSALPNERTIFSNFQSVVAGGPLDNRRAASVKPNRCGLLRTASPC